MMARQGYCSSAPEHVGAEEWDYWYDGHAVSIDLKSPDGKVVVKAGEKRDGGSYEEGVSRIAVWNSVMGLSWTSTSTLSAAGMNSFELDPTMLSLFQVSSDPILPLTPMSAKAWATVAAVSCDRAVHLSSYAKETINQS
ncbi:MAG: hypothetical protein ACR2QJ_07765 [Geminicoccaceae bacterium]